MFFQAHGMDNQKLVTFYVAFTSVYFTGLLLTLYLSDGIYTVGKYSFQSVLLIIIFAEIVKYFISVVYFKKSDLNLLKKHEEISSAFFLKNLLSKSKLKEGCRNAFTFCLMTVVYFTVSVLYGAEVFTKYEETLMFSMLLSALTVFPLCINLGCFSVISVFLECRPGDKLEYMLYQNLYLTLLGAWLGAFVIPLDWDRPWQEWPIPCSCGAMVGFLFSHFLTVFHLRLSHPKRKRN